MARPGGGFAAGDISEVRAITGKESPGIGCAYDAFSGTANGIKAYWAHILITHEMVNLFTGQIVSGGWPVDWWANHRSPFPLMTAVQIEYALVPHMAVFHERQGREDPLVGMFLQLKDQFGWAMFRKAFRTAIDDGVNWNAFGANPSALRTAYVAAYLQIGGARGYLGAFWGRWSRVTKPRPSKALSSAIPVVGFAREVCESPVAESSLPQRRLHGRVEMNADPVRGVLFTGDYHKITLRWDGGHRRRTCTCDPYPIYTRCAKTPLSEHRGRS